MDLETRNGEKAEPIVLTDLISYDVRGKPIIKYTARLDGMAIQKTDGGYLIKTPRGFKKYFASAKDGRKLPDLREMYAIIERLYDTKNPALVGVVRDLVEDSLCTNTRISPPRLIKHPGYKGIYCPVLPPSDFYFLKEVIMDKNNRWSKRFFQALLGPKDLEKVPEVLQAIGIGQPQFMIATDYNSSIEDRVASIYIYGEKSEGRFVLDCLFPSYRMHGRARGVRVEKT